MKAIEDFPFDWIAADLQQASASVPLRHSSAFLKDFNAKLPDTQALVFDLAKVSTYSSI
jgi:hypothetical protein